MNIRISSKDYEIIKKFADFHGKNISAFMLDSAFEQIEYWEDMKAIAEYERQKEHIALYSIQEIIAELE